ncbi:MAG: cell surface protein SprA [Bacteroidales bacterium]|nr:cell surface protein SprA [Bacteroidales bacterium]
MLILFSFFFSLRSNAAIIEFPYSPPDSTHYGSEGNSPLHLNDPSNITTTIEYDEKNNEYILIKKVGDLVIEKRVLSFEEYQNYDLDKMINSYWKNRSASAKVSASNEGLLDNLIPQFRVNSELFETIFGGQTIEIRPSGSAELIFSVVNNNRQDLSIQESQRSVTRFDFDENIQINATAKIGEAISFNLNYNTGATFSFENEFKLKYEGKEDNIIQVIEAGNISFPLPTTLIQGSQTLFGVKTKLKFGKLFVDAVFSQQKSESSSVTVQGGAEMREFNIKADEYEANRHYFLAQYFYENYNNAMASLPLINSKINIIKIEIWRTNVGAAVNENRNIVAFADLGEVTPYGTSPFIQKPGGLYYPDQNRSNNLLSVVNVENIRNINNVSALLQGMGFVSGQNYEKIESARKLNSSEYYFNSRLGFISLNQPLTNDQVLAVAFRYQIIGDTTIYQVGEFSDEGINDPNTLVVKLLKSSTLNVRNPMWKLMMKNIYSLQAYQIQQEDFRLNVLYQGDEQGIPTGYFNEGSKKGVPLLQIFGWDRMDNQQNNFPDGVFDFIDNAIVNGGTIVSDRGLVIFPYVEPFGKDLRSILNDDDIADKYCFDSLYTLTISQAQQYPDKNKYYLEGRYKSEGGSEISLNGTNIPQGSVRVMAGGIQLMEGVDYTVDYAMGRVRIINQGYLSSGTPITVSTESQDMFSMTTKRLMGLRASYEISQDITLGATLLNLHESPITSKVNYGEEPMSNTLWGFDFNYRKEVNFITKLIDWLPFYSTNAPSTLSLTGEFAHFIPGNPSVIGSTGTSYIDDFEAAKTSIDLRAIGSWYLASTPQDYASANALFPETQKNSGLEYGFNRAKIAWYSIDDIFYSSSAPSNINKDDRSQPYARQILEREVHPNKEIASGQPTNIREFNLAFYPSERGPYNYDTTSVYSYGLNSDGSLKRPDTRWGGVMRKLESTDFEAANIEYIEFWLMDPFIGNENAKGGKLYFNIGDISEDILRDGRKSFENGLPSSNNITDVDTTIWGRVPRLQAIVNAFDNDPATRQYQDIGYDGLGSTDEQSFFERFLFKAQEQLTPEAYNILSQDASADDFRYFRSTMYDNNNVKITDRYKYYNNSEGNSAVTDNSNELYSTQQTSLPNVEDINQDNTLSEAENYYEYEIDLDPNSLVIGQNYITDIQNATNIALPNGEYTDCKWYQFKIPVRIPSKTVGAIEGFQSIRFMRMFLRGFNEPVILRFATFELVSGDWRKYTDNLLAPGMYPSGTQKENTTFTVASVNIEENGKRSPIPYVLPPGIDREKMYSSTSFQQMNEQALSMKVTDLSDGDARAIYKTSDIDMRQYKKLQMFVHAEKVLEKDTYKKGDVNLFVRLGADFTNNYYEYELPLTFTPWHTGQTADNLIWPQDNNVDIDLEKIVQVKENRNAKIRSGDTKISSLLPYSEMVDGRKVTILGSPSISSVKVMMIGVRNPKKAYLTDNDDMQEKSVEVWINELRLTDFNKSSGWAATGFARTNLADLGDLSLSGSYRSAGFGTLEKSISEISQDNVGAFDISTNLELGKFFSKTSGIRIPMHFDYSQQVSNPRYNPLDPDVLLKDDLLTYKTEKEKDSIRNMVQDFTSRTNINFMNVRKEKIATADSKQYLLGIENFDASYSFSNIFRRDVDIAYNSKTQHRGGINYNYTFKSKPLKPLSKVKLFKNKAWTILRDLTFNYKPRTISVRTEAVRDFEETLIRPKSQGLIKMEPYYFKQFYWNRIYSFAYDITQNLKLNYNATMNARIDEPRGKIDTKEKRDSVWSSVFDLGRAQEYRQKTDITFNIPIYKIPILDWLRVNTAYNAEFIFSGSTQALERLGNTIENSARKSINVNLNLVQIYNKIPFVKKILSENTNSRQDNRPKRFDPKELNNKKDSTATDSISTFVKIMKEVGKYSIRLLTSVKNASINYSQNDGTYIPGFMPISKFIGLSPSNSWAPGFGFVFGSQANIMEKAIEKRWLSTDSLMNNAFQQKSNKTLNGQIQLEPIKDFKINLRFNQSQSENYVAYYKYDQGQDRVTGPLSAQNTGNFSTTIITLGTMFRSLKDDNVSETFQNFLDYRDIIAQRLAKNNPNYNGNMIMDTSNGKYYPDGYGATSQQVLIPAFLAAYTGSSPDSRSLNPFTKIPLPNWTIDYTGLSKIKWLQKWVNSITISNAYTSTYSVGSFTSDVRVPTNNSRYDYGTEWIKNETNNNYLPRDVIDNITINESLSPLIKIDINLKNSFQANFEIRKDRNLSLSFSNKQLTEMNRVSYVIGGGYRFKEVEINIRAGESSRQLKSDIDINATLTWNKNTTILRKIDQKVNLMSSGSDVLNLNLSGEYSITEKIILTAFFEMTINTPYISNAYPNSMTQGGFKLRIII